MVRDCAFALANLADSLELQGDIVREGGIEVWADPPYGRVCVCGGGGLRMREADVLRGVLASKYVTGYFVSSGDWLIGWRVCFF